MEWIKGIVWAFGLCFIPASILSYHIEANYGWVKSALYAWGSEAVILGSLMVLYLTVSTIMILLSKRYLVTNTKDFREYQVFRHRAEAHAYLTQSHSGEARLWHRQLRSGLWREIPVEQDINQQAA